MSDSHSEDVVAALRPVANAFDSLGVRFYVGGSVASSFHGAMRSTMDVDVVAELRDNHVTQFVEILGEAYYASEPAIRDAIRRRASFNLIHLATSFKVDVFANKNRPYDQSVFERAAVGSLGVSNQIQVPIASPEDSIISKLEWYRLGGEVSERQWNDVSTLMRLLVDKIENEYLSSAAREVGVQDLMDKLRAESK